MLGSNNSKFNFKLPSAGSLIVAAVFVTLTFSVSRAIAGADACNFVFDSAPVSRNTISEFVDWAEYKRHMYTHFLGSPGSIPLSLTAKMPYPVSRHISPDNKRSLEWDGKQNRDYVGTPDPVSPVVAISRIVVASRFDEKRYYEAVYGNYTPVIKDNLIRQLMEIDKELEFERTSSWVVNELTPTKAHGPEVFGTFRVYDGSIVAFGLQFVDKQNIHPGLIGPKPLPFQRINRARGIKKLEVEEFIEAQIRAGRKVFEMGKFSLSGETEVRNRSREILETFFLREVLELYPDAIFIGHVASPVHARLYQSRYEMKPAQKYAVQGNSDGEMVVWATGQTMAEKLRESLGLPNAGPVPSPPRKSGSVLPEFPPHGL